MSQKSGSKNSLLRRSSFSLPSLNSFGRSKPQAKLPTKSRNTSQSNLPDTSQSNLPNTSQSNLPNTSQLDPKAYMNEKWYEFLKKKYNLTDDQMDEYVDSFEMINKGNPITVESFMRFISDADDDDYWNVNDCKKVLEYINSTVKKDPRKPIDLCTYMTYIIPVCNIYEISTVEVRELFDTIDTDQDNYITCTQLINLIYKINKNLSVDELCEYKRIIKSICVQIDVNGDGLISYDEFKNFILNHGFDKK